MEKYGFKWMVLVLFGSELYTAYVVFIENWQQRRKKKNNIVHDVFSSHNYVHLWIVYQIKTTTTKNRKEKKKKFVDALIVNVVRFSRFDFKFLTALHIGASGS